LWWNSCFDEKEESKDGETLNTFVDLKKKALRQKRDKKAEKSPEVFGVIPFSIEQ